MILDFDANEKRLLEVFRQEKDVGASAAVLSEVVWHLRGVSIRERGERLEEWQQVAALHPCALDWSKEPIDWPWRVNIAQDMGSPVVTALQVMKLAKERVGADPEAPRKARLFADEVLGEGEKVAQSAIREAVREIHFAFGEEDAIFWSNAGLDKHLCEVLLEARKAVQKTATEPGGEKERK